MGWAKMAINNSTNLMDALNQFDKADGNNDHKISRSEFIEHMKLSHLISCGEWDALFDELDVDKNGNLAHSEFWAKMAINNSTNLMDALNQFDKADGNNDHKIS